MAPGSDVTTWQTGHVAGIVLRRPKAINALTTAMVEDITTALDTFAADLDTRTVVIQGEGRGLCAGGDMKAIRALVADGGGDPTAFFAREYEMNARIATFPKPIVAVMDGIVMGGGVGLSAHASHRVVTERSVLAMPEVAIGFAPDVGSTWLLAHAPGQLGTYVGLTGARLDGTDAIELGLADHVVLSERIPELIDALATDAPSGAITNVATDPAVPAAAGLARQRSWIDEAFAADTVLGIIERLEASSEPRAVMTAAELRAASPTALVATFEALRFGQSAPDLETCLRNEFRVGTAMIGTADFLEGTRAVLLDKTADPRWDPPILTADVEHAVSAWIRTVEATAPGPDLPPPSTPRADS